MRTDIIKSLICPDCFSGRLHEEIFDLFNNEDINNGVLVCNNCRNWYPIENGLLELLVEPLCYRNDRLAFCRNFSRELKGLGCGFPNIHRGELDYSEQLKQQKHSDWFAVNPECTYTAYQNMPFWKVVDEISFAEWRKEIKPNSFLLDVGCAQGRSSFPFMGLDFNMVGFDISKSLIIEAIQRYKQNKYNAKATFFVADAAKFPFAASSFDYVLTYGTIHHLPSPKIAFQEIIRVLKPAGIYFGSENNESIFRTIFDLLQKALPLWHEEAGSTPLICEREVRNLCSGLIDVEVKSMVFVPPHLVNIVGYKNGKRLLNAFDTMFRCFPVLNKNGGLILIKGKKPKE